MDHHFLAAKCRQLVAGIVMGASLLVSGCQQDPESRPVSRYNQPKADVLFSQEVRQVVIEVDYADGYTPFTGKVGKLDDLWELTRASLQRVFRSSPKTIMVPNTADQMERLADATERSWTVESILKVADAHRDQRSSGATTTFYVVFLPGHYEDKEGPRPDVLGVSVGTTGVIAIFKDVVESANGDDSTTSKLVEQSTIVHEFGHAVGLVNQGVPLTTEHQDEHHGTHCTNPKCVLYFENDGLKAVNRYVRQLLDSDERVIFGDECLEDVDKFGKLLK